MVKRAFSNFWSELSKKESHVDSLDTHPCHLNGQYSALNSIETDEVFSICLHSNLIP